MPKKETERKFCSCKSTCSTRTVKNEHRGCPCKTAGVKCGNKCRCGTAKLSCRNTEFWKKPPKSEPGSASARHMPYDSNNNFSEAFGDPRNRKEGKEDKEEGAAYKPFKFEEGSEGESDNNNEEVGASNVVHHSISSIQEQPSTSTKRRTSEAFTGEAAVDVITLETEESAYKHRKLISERSGDESDSEALNGEVNADVVFALDYSSSVTEDELRNEINFVGCLAESWNVTPGYSKAAVVVYGGYSKTVIPFNSDDTKLFSEEIAEMKTETLLQSDGRRMDLALTEAAKNLMELQESRSQNEHQLVILITAGKQLLKMEDHEEDKNDRLLTAAEELLSNDIKVIIVPVGLEIDFRELALIVKRPQSLFPLSGFDDLTPRQAKKIASYMKKTIDIDAYAKKQFHRVSFSGIPSTPGLWEKISLCSDVIEGAWYLLYDDLKKSRRPEKVKSLIRESIDNFHSTLVSDSKICISVAVFGPLGAGKSFFLNFVLNWGLSEQNRVENGPLPSASGGSQTPLPIYVKYGKKVQVLCHKQTEGSSPDVWFLEEELRIDTLVRVNNLLTEKFQQARSLSDAKCIELQGPFPVFGDLKERAMTSCGHLELEVDVEFVDVPGLGDQTGNHSINIELSKADVVLFFDNSKSGRPVSSEDIAQIFRRRDEFEFTSRPKLVHVVNNRGSDVPSGTFDDLCRQKMEDLKGAWSNFLPNGPKDEKTASDCYQDVLANLPQLNGEALLEKLREESEVIYFHTGNPSVIKSLKGVITHHVQNVKIKETIHPFLQNVHWAAKKLRTRIGKSQTTEKKKKKSQPYEVEGKKGQPTEFKMFCDADQVSDLVSYFLDHTNLPLHSDIGGMYDYLYNNFMTHEKTVKFLLDSLEVSLENYRRRLIESYKNVNWSASRDISDLIDLGEMLSESRVQQYCANSAQTYLLHVLEKQRNRNPFGREHKKKWSSACEEERQVLCGKFLHVIWQHTTGEGGPFEKEPRTEHKKSHFHFMSQLKQDVMDLFAFGRLEDDARRLEVFKLLNKPIDIVIKFCAHSIREINPHPSLDVQADISNSLPEKMKDAHEGDIIPLESRHDKIIKDVTDLLLKPASKGADAIRRLESRLSLGKGALVLRQPQTAYQQRLWPKALVNILSDEDHFNTPLDPKLKLERQDPDVERLLIQARRRLFAHEKSSVTCELIEQEIPDKEIHVKKGSMEEKRLEVWVSPKMRHNLRTIRNEFKDPMHQIAPIFMPTIRPGPTGDMQGNFFLEEDPWSKDVSTNTGNIEEEDSNTVEEGLEKESKTIALDLNIFLVVEQQHLQTFQSTVDGLEVPSGRNINLMYIVLPQKGRGIGVTRAIIKSLAECLNFSLYWTIDDDIQYMYQFDENDRKWHKCSLVRGLLFGQRVFQTCQEKTVKELSADDRADLYEEVTSNWPSFAKKTKRAAQTLLIDRNSFSEVQKNPSLLHAPFANVSIECYGDPAKEEEMKTCEQEFVDTCRKRLFEDAVDHIAGISLAHESTKKYDYMSKYPTADYMRSEQRYQVVLNNTRALKGKNFVTDEVIFHEEEFQIHDQDKRNTPYWGIRGEDKSFCHALTVGGVIGYQVIRVVHSHKKMTNVFDRVGPSYIGSQSPYRSEDEDEEGMDANS